MTIRVLLTDDHRVVRQGIKMVLDLDPELEVVGEASNGEEALRLAQRLKPDVVLMDLMMPEMDGASATAAIRRQFPQIRVIALTSYREDDLVHRVIQAGATGYLLKSVSGIDLAQAIRAAHAGRPTLAPEATQALINAATKPAAPGHDLSARERDVLALMVKGLSNTEIAHRLTISQATVKGHVSNILAKLGVTSRTEAVALTVEHRII